MATPKPTPKQLANEAAMKRSQQLATPAKSPSPPPTAARRPTQAGATPPSATPPASMDPTDLQQWAIDFLDQLPGAAKVTNPNDARVSFLINWASVEGTYGTTNPNNPLDITGKQAGIPSGDLGNNPNQNNGDPVQTYQNFTTGAKALDNFLKAGHTPILNALRSTGSTTQTLGDALAQSGWTGKGAQADANYAQTVANDNSTAGTASPGIVVTGTNGVTGSDASNPAPIQTGSQKFAAPEAGVDIKNFHGFDLSSFEGTNELGNAENAIAAYVNPNAKDANGLTLQQRIAQDYGYTAGWALQHPEVGAVLIWSAQYADPSTAAGRAQELSQLQKTQWYQTTSENKRAFEAAQSTDPAKAQQAIVDAQDKVHATAAQIGVDLTPTQLNAIAKAYAAQAYVPEGTLGAASGTSQEQLDSMVMSAVSTVQKTGGLPGVDTTATFNPTAIPGGPTGETGIAGQLFQALKGVAQQYLMYSSSPSSPLTDADLNKYVASYMQNYVGSGSYGSSNLQQGAIQSFTSLMQQQSSQLYPTLAPVVKMGTTPQTYTKPITNLIENTLGLTTGSVDLTQPKWNFALKNDPTTGAPMTQDQILAKVVQMPEYDKSDTAINNAHTVANGLAQAFGIGG